MTKMIEIENKGKNDDSHVANSDYSEIPRQETAIVLQAHEQKWGSLNGKTIPNFPIIFVL